MRALSGMLRRGVFHNRAKLYARPEVREILLAQHRAIVEAVMARDPEAAGEASREHMTYTRRVMDEIAAAEARLEISLRRIDGGNSAGASSRQPSPPKACVSGTSRRSRASPRRRAARPGLRRRTGIPSRRLGERP